MIILAEKLKSSIAKLISSAIPEEVDVVGLIPISGGSINETYKVQSSAGNFFLKINDAKRYPQMFEKEAEGLNLLRGKQVIRVPEVVGSVEVGDYSVLVMEYIEQGQLKHGFWEYFGEQLASLHRHTNSDFGLSYDNYIGSLSQRNAIKNRWVEFFINERLEIQVRLARDMNKVDARTVSYFERLYNRLEEIFPLERPSLLHGDLWNGNFIIGPNGEPVIVDPAVYYGHREMDIAMTRLFGGFDKEMYLSYNDHYPLEKEWEERLPICNLYPLMVHVNLFGESYLNQVTEVLRRF